MANGASRSPARSTSSGCGATRTHHWRDINESFRIWSPFSTNLYPSFGYGITAKRAPITVWADHKKQRTGDAFVFAKGNRGEIRGVVADVNTFKSRFIRRLALPRGTKGTVYLNPKADDIKMVADHYLAERGELVSANGRKVIEWTEIPNRDNHRFNTAVIRRAYAVSARRRKSTAATCP